LVSREVDAPTRPVLGLDIGGSSSRARLSAGGHIVAEAAGRGANVAVIAPRLVEARVTALIGELGSPQPVACCAGVAGAEVPEGRQRMERLLHDLLPGARVQVVHDTRLILAAAGLETGIVLIAGTGSVAYGRDSQGRELRVGGWGWMLGDEGSGVWIVREAAREVLRRRDAGEPLGVLGEAMLQAARAQDVAALSGKLHGLREPGRWAALARAVFASAARDGAAGDVIERAAAGLYALVEQVQGRLAVQGPVVMAGGLILNQPLLETAVRTRIGGAVRLQAPPVEGAVRIAQSM
jgi:glucosamine kinase